MNFNGLGGDANQINFAKFTKAINFNSRLETSETSTMRFLRLKYFFGMFINLRLLINAKVLREVKFSCPSLSRRNYHRMQPIDG